VRRATVDVGEPLRDVEAVAGELERRWAELDEGQRGLLASRLRAGVTRLEAEIALLADVGAMDAGGAGRPEPVSLRRAVEDCLLGLGDRLSDHVIEFDVPALKVVGDRRAIRRVVWSLLENAAEHTPAGTRVRVAAVPTAGHAVLVVADNGPGVPPEAATNLFEQPDDAGRRQPVAGLGLPLVRELCEALGARVRYEPAPGGGARCLVFFRLAPSSAPGPDDEPTAGGQVAPHLGGAVGAPE
jgi:signal transduction histidine kinase